MLSSVGRAQTLSSVLMPMPYCPFSPGMTHTAFFMPFEAL